ncbi:MAG: thioesterase family protein, partial [Boseongicola sp.]|nr:thioesterase family protein [Boseongicola sp.]
SAAGALIEEHERTLPKPDTNAVPMITIRRVIPIDWTDYNGHMNESRYGQVYSDAADATMVAFGADSEYVASGLSYFTVENTIKYLAEAHAGEACHVATRVLLADGKKLKLYHEMRRDSDGEVYSTCTQFLLHVSLETRKTCPPRDDVAARLAALALAHSEGTT